MNKKRLLLLLMLWGTMLTASQTVFAEETVTKVKYPVKGYRNFWEGSLGVKSATEGIAQFSMIHGCQITPQLFAGVGVMLEAVLGNIQYDCGTHLYQDYDYVNVTPFASVRYDIIPRKVTPYLEGRLGYRKPISVNDNTTPDNLYVVPVFGVRIRHFNIGISYETTNVKVDMKEDLREGSAYYYQIKEFIAMPALHIGFDFGAREKN